MASKVYYSPFIPAFSGNGLPVPSAKLYFFYTGTNNPAPIYTDSGMTTPAANPVQSDLAGRFSDTYLDESVTYRVRLTTAAGAPIGADIDPYIPGTALKGDPGPAGNVAANLTQLKSAATSNTTMIYDGVLYNWTTGNFTGLADDLYIIQSSVAPITTGAWLRQVKGFLNLEDFLPANFVTNGTVDYTTNIQAAVDKAKVLGKTLLFPAGIFKVSGTGVLLTTTGGQQIDIAGQGNRNTTVVNSNGNVLRVSGQFINCSDIAFVSSAGGHTVVQTGIFARSVWTRVLINQGANGYSLWDNAAQEFVANNFNDWVFEHTTTSTVYSFNLVAAAGLINNNVWRQGWFQNTGTRHAFNIESTTSGSQVSNVFEDILFEVCCGGGIRGRALNGSALNCFNWDCNGTGNVVNDFYDLGNNGSSIGCQFNIAECDRRDSTMAGGKYDVVLPTGGGGANCTVVNCRASGGAFTVNANSNGFYARGIFGTGMALTNGGGYSGFDPANGYCNVPVEYRLGNVKVVGSRDTGWTAATGTTSKGAFASAAAGTASGSYVQAELQGALNRIAALEARLVAYDAMLRTHGLIGT